MHLPGHTSFDTGPRSIPRAVDTPAVRTAGRAAVTAATVLLVLLGTSAVATAQEETPETDDAGWSTELTGNLSGSQASYRNWAEGGVNTFSFSSSLQGEADHTEGPWHQEHDLRLTLGYLKSNGRKFRKSDDLIRLDASLIYQGGHGVLTYLDPTVGVNVRTQFAPGFDYRENPFGDDRDPPVRISEFMAPGTFTQSLGLVYDEYSWFTQRVGLGGKQTWVRVPEFRPLYGLETDQAVRWEIGVEARTEVDRELLENTRIRSSLALFKSFGAADLPDLLWENLLTIDANQWLTTNLELVFLYDADVSRELQLKQVLSLGVSFTLI